LTALHFFAHDSYQTSRIKLISCYKSSICI